MNVLYWDSGASLEKLITITLLIVMQISITTYILSVLHAYVHCGVGMFLLVREITKRGHVSVKKRSKRNSRF